MLRLTKGFQWLFPTAMSSIGGPAEDGIIECLPHQERMIGVQAVAIAIIPRRTGIELPNEKR